MTSGVVYYSPGGMGSSYSGEKYTLRDESKDGTAGKTSGRIDSSFNPSKQLQKVTDPGMKVTIDIYGRDDIPAVAGLLKSMKESSYTGSRRFGEPPHYVTYPRMNCLKDVVLTNPLATNKKSRNINSQNDSCRRYDENEDDICGHRDLNIPPEWMAQLRPNN